MAPRTYKEQLYGEFARVAHALGSQRRLEIVDLLAQAPRRVESLAGETGMSVANVSQHLQVLKNARLVDAERQGAAVTYRLAGPSVVAAWLALRDLAAARSSDIGRLREEFSSDGGGSEVPREEARRLIARGDAVLVDVRPAREFEHAHVPGAISIPVDELPDRLRELPAGKRIIAYCRGAYCLMADDAVALLRSHGFDAVRLEGGWPEWMIEPTAADWAKRPSNDGRGSRRRSAVHG